MSFTPKAQQLEATKDISINNLQCILDSINLSVKINGFFMLCKFTLKGMRLLFIEAHPNNFILVD
jgi:hypothetical protein